MPSTRASVPYRGITMERAVPGRHHHHQLESQRSSTSSSLRHPYYSFGDLARRWHLSHASYVWESMAQNHHRRQQELHRFSVRQQPTSPPPIKRICTPTPRACLLPIRLLWDTYPAASSTPPFPHAPASSDRRTSLPPEIQPIKRRQRE